MSTPRLLLFRRLIVLLTFGLIHLCLIWNGDILTEYAVAGLIVLPFLFGSRWLLAGGAAAFLGGVSRDAGMAAGWTISQLYFDPT